MATPASFPSSSARRLMFGERVIPVALPVRAPRLVRALLTVAQALEAGDRAAAVSEVSRGSVVPAMEGASEAVVTAVVSPTLRAQALARVLLDLFDGGWRVVVEDGQIHVVAPVFRAGGNGLTPDEIRAEKARIRASLAERVREQLERPATRTFIINQERAHFTREGPRSILNLIADGPRLAAAVREQGAEAIQPYLQAADVDSGRDQYTGLRLCDVFRYFRYFWSFPFGSTPGRTLPILVRDAGQRGHPVCGLLALSSPVPRLGARDGALGWTPAWLEAIVAGLDVPAHAPRPHLVALEAELRRTTEPCVDPPSLFRDLSIMLAIAPSANAESLAASLARLGPTEANARLRSARISLCRALVDEIKTAIEAISFEGLGVSVEEALRVPERARRMLEARATRARAKWLDSRTLVDRSGPVADRPTSDSLSDGASLRRLSATPLFEKKRAEQALRLLGAWHEVADLRGHGLWDRMRARITGVAAPWSAGSRINGGKHVASGLRAALRQRQSRFLASQVTDVSVCGAVPPYGPLLGGKLVALLALSREPARLYYERYANQVSEIGSQMSGRQVVRPADLVAMTTTSFYGVGSSQYERLRLPSGVGWRFVGYSAGHGTLHFSAEASALMLSLVRAETGRGLITSTFGEGPSERLRKVREGLARLGLDVEALLQHGMPRQVFIAELAAGATRPGGHARQHWRNVGPSADETAGYWRERWLAPRLTRMPELLSELERFARPEALLSTRLTAGVQIPLAWISTGGNSPNRKGGGCGRSGLRRASGAASRPTRARPLGC